MDPPKILQKYRINTSSKETIEPEEIFLDSGTSDETNFSDQYEKMELPIKRSYFLGFYSLILISLLVLLGYTGYLQGIKGGYYRTLAEENKIRSYALKAPRGIIYDRLQKQLVQNIPIFDVEIIPADLPQEKKGFNKIIKELASLLELESLEIKTQLEKRSLSSSKPLLVKENIDRSTALILESKGLEMKGVRVVKGATREYLNGPYFAHILGYIGKVTSQDLKRNPQYLLTDYIGKSGIEFQYEEVLRGQHGIQKVETDSLGEKKKIVTTEEPLPGKSLILNIDSDLQTKLYDELNKALADLSKEGALGAAAIAMDPRDGRILALVSLPSFDNNYFARGISQESLDRLIDDPKTPLFSRTISGEYPPGSTIKPLIAVAALEEGVINSRKSLNCRGVINVPNQYNPNIVYHFHDWKAHGIVDLRRAIAQSCNIFFYYLGGGYKDFQGLGIEKIEEYARLFGLGSSLGIDLPGEKEGLIPTKAWKKEKKGELWYEGDTYHAAIGQGDIAVTPLQLASYIATIANRGTLYQPQVVDKIVDTEKNVIEDIEPQVIRNGFIDLQNIEVVREGMREAVLSGSALSLSDLPFKAAGKTGTAQFGSEGKTHAWFTAFAPYEDPEVVLVVLIEGGGEGARTALPVAKEVLRWYFGER